MKCPLCTPGRYPEWPTLRQVGIQDWLKCPVCKALFDRDGREIEEKGKSLEEKPILKKRWPIHKTD